MGLPSGDVTFVFSDIEGSTRLLKRLGGRYDEINERHADLLRRAWRAHEGHEVNTEGDSFFVAFTNPGDAIEACAEAQQLLAEERWPEDGVVRVRMGVHSGLAFPRHGDYLALAVNRAKRVSDAAHGGQVLVSEESVVSLRPDLSLASAGRFRLRDFDEPVRLFRVRSPYLDESITAVRAMPAEGHNLVRPATSYLARDEEVASSSALAAGRVVTLAGPGGVGKTRIAVEVGIQVAPAWADGVWLVDLAEVEDPVLVANAIADAVGIHGDAANGDRWTDVIGHLRSRSALVILDNAESHLDACATLASELVIACPGVGVLATSRRPLGVGGEVVVRVSPLPTPVATQLFVERAQSARSGFALDAESTRVVNDICERLDGLPLAIEIAAARIGVLEVREILEGLDDRLRLLRSRDRSLPERQRSMTALLEWSYRLLDADEQAALRRLSVFGSGFTLAAAAVAVADEGLDADDVPELVWALVDHSLLVADLAANGTRYRFLETVQRYGRDLLADEGATVDVAARLAAWLLDQLGPWRALDRTWLGDMGLELTNMRALIPLLAGSQPEVAQQLACAIGRYHYLPQGLGGGIEEMTHYVDELTLSTPSRVAMLTTLGDIELRTANIKAAEAAVAEAEHLRDIVGVPAWDEVCVERTSGEIALRVGDLDRAMVIAEDALQRNLSSRARARMLNLLGLASMFASDLDAALTAFEEELEVLLVDGHEGILSTAHGNLAEAAMRVKRPATAARHQLAGLDLALALGQPVPIAYSLIMASRITAATGGWRNAVELYCHAEAMLQETGHRLYEADQELSDEVMHDARIALGDSAFVAASEAGRTLRTGDAVTMAQEVLAAVPERAITDPRPAI